MTLMIGVWTFKFLTTTYLLQLISYFLMGIFNFNSFFFKYSFSVEQNFENLCFGNLQNGNLKYFYSFHNVV